MKRKAINRLAKQLQSLETEEGLYHLLKTSRQKFELLLINPPYHIFQIPKRNGEFRTIEDPADELQRIQASLKNYLQALYHCNRTDAAYGYISKADDEPEKRGIYGNALAHLQNAYLLNIDLEDFFHFIRWQKVYDTLTMSPFGIHEKIAPAICSICTFQGRLPMGAPTSPALSNIAAYPFDLELSNYCRQENITYTRYVDDMSFSAPAQLADRHFQQISTIITTHGYEVNRKKLKWFGPDETKMITGLEAKGGVVKVPDNFIDEVHTEIENIKAWVLLQTRMNPARPLEPLLFKPLQKINGALAFIESVHGDDYEQLVSLQNKLGEAVQPPADYESLNWLEIGYEIF